MKGVRLEDPNAAAVCLANKAEEMSLHETYLSPFAKGAKESGKKYQGGKPDDITVIVAQIELGKK